MFSFRYPQIAFKVYKEIKRQKQYNRSFLFGYLDELEKKYNGKFEPEQRKKITDYYGLFITSFLCSSYKRLYGKELSDEERKRATLFGIMTPVGDDLFDIDKLDIKDIRTITFNPESYTATTFSSSVCKEIQSYLLHSVPHKKAYLKASEDVLDIQVATIKQVDPNISQEEIRKITYTKGAVSVIIYHQCMDDEASPQMLAALSDIGGLYQLGNDIFDLYKDVRDGIYTLVNTCNNFKEFKVSFLEQVKEQNRKIYALPYPQKDKKDFCIVMNTINARSLVALDNLIKTEERLDTPIDWSKRERKDMIVDMEKATNILSWLRYVHKLPNLV